MKTAKKMMDFEFLIQNSDIFSQKLKFKI